MRNAVIVLTAVAVLVVGFVLVQGAEGDGSGTPAAAPVEEAAPPETATEAAGSTAEETAPAPRPKPEPAVPTVVYEGGAPKGGVKRLRFEEGDQVRFRIRSDVADEVHVHGFDTYVDVDAGKTTTIAFKARFDGAYEVEMHGSGTQVATLEIQP